MTIRLEGFTSEAEARKTLSGLFKTEAGSFVTSLAQENGPNDTLVFTGDYDVCSGYDPTWGPKTCLPNEACGPFTDADKSDNG